MIAAVEGSHALTIEQQSASGPWRVIASVPMDARALRFASSGELFWLQDDVSGERPVTRAFALDLLSPAGAHALNAAAVNSIARAPAFARFDPSATPGQARIQKDCLPAWNVCGPALRVLDWRPGQILAATNAVVVDRSQAGSWQSSILNVVDGGFDPDGAWIVRRTDDHARVVDTLSRRHGDERWIDLAQAPIIVSAEEGNDGRYYVVERRVRRDQYEEMLAHAPLEFGGQEIGGDAIEIEPRTGAETPIAGLIGRQVRLVVPCPQALIR